MLVETFDGFAIHTIFKPFFNYIMLH